MDKKSEKGEYGLKKAVVIGGSGKVGSYLTPLLAREGFEVLCVGRTEHAPVVESPEWADVRRVRLDRNQAGFEKEIASLGAEVVVDMICFADADMQRMVEALRGRVGHYLVCGSMWMHGRSAQVPVREEECREPLEAYGVQKEKMDRSISREYRENGFPGTIVHPGHIVCPGDVPINPQGCKSLEAFAVLKAGRTLVLPNLGMETLHHVHAKDVAGVFLAAVKAGERAYGEGFHAVSPRAVTLYGYAQEAARWFGREADIALEPFETWKKRMSERDAAATLEHIAHSPNGSMEKAERMLGFAPEYSSLDAVRECIASLGVL